MRGPELVEDVVAILLVDPAGGVLLQLRDRLAPNAPGMWSTVGGGVEDGETPDAAAHRELAEETGLAALPLRLWWQAVLLGGDGVTYKRWYVYVCATGATDTDIRLGEGADIRFVAPEMVDGLDLVPAARTVLERLLASPEHRRLAGEAPTRGS